MDSAVVKTMLEVQDQAYRGFLEIQMKQVDDKLQSMQATINKLTRSLEFTQRDVDDLKEKVKLQDQEIKCRTKENQELTARLDASSNIIKELQDKSNYQENYNHRNNLQFLGIEERPRNETWEQLAVKISDLLTEKLQLPNVQLECAHRVGQRQENRHRPIIARFTRFSDREAILRNVTKLKGTRIFVNEDLCAASQELRKFQLPMLKQAKSQGKIAYFRHTKLIVKDRLASNGTRVPVNTVDDSRGSSSSAPVLDDGHRDTHSVFPTTHHTSSWGGDRCCWWSSC
ncbi:Protein unc-13 C [Portunus trituberculatus]|uniref:Protein unc-13 C n=1 Tax=Portunus trituberculatus TaxID=210409 RepID=A0A5B7HSD0_PORTR|nr:Protein unc-13 C [Portunus trituberculatus]